MEAFHAALFKLKNFVEREDYRGYDPYDTLNSYLPFGVFGKWGRVLAIQLQKRNPVNIRPLIGIKKEINPKAMGLLLHAYTLMYRMDKKPEDLERMRGIFGWLQANYTKGYSGHCWGYNFVWAGPSKTLGRFHPTIVVTAFVCKGIYEYYTETRDPQALAVLQSASQYILRDLPVTETADGTCYSYSDVKKDCCYNASMLGAETLARLYSLTGDASLKAAAIKATDFTVAHQHADGHWNYDLDPATGVEKKQIDFHQGYVIDSVETVMRHCAPGNTTYLDALKKGLSYYRSEQFYPDGRSLWRVPKKYPVEIHNQAQGILTFSRMKNLFPEHFPFAKVIAEYTLANMQDADGFFYYRLLPLYKNKIPFMRWSQAWMLLALAELASVSSE